MWMVKASAAEAGVGADVGGRLLAADVLLAGRERQHEAAPALGVDGLAAQPARHLAHELLARREQADIGAAEVQRVADRLALADDDVGAHLARRLQQAERHRLGDHHDQQRAGGVGRLGDLATSVTMPKTSGVWTTTQAVSASIAAITSSSRVDRGGRRDDLDRRRRGRWSAMVSA